LFKRSAAIGDDWVMRQRAFLILAWLAATSVAVLLAWQGIGFIGREVTSRRPEALSASEVQAQIDATTATTTTSTAAGSPGSAPDPGAPVAQPTTTPGANATTPGTSRNPSGVTTTTTTTTVRAAGTPAPSSTSTTSPPAPSAETRTYNAQGGSAAIRFEPGKVTLVWATPNAGFETDVEQSSADHLRVRFRNDDHESRIEARWDGGPVGTIEEKD
jgi:hypothetical protein